MFGPQEFLVDAFSKLGVSDLQKAIKVASISQGDKLRLPVSVPRYVHFLKSGMTSGSLIMSDGRNAAVRLYISGDLLEIQALLGVAVPDQSVTVLIQGDIIRVPFDLLKQAFERDGNLRGHIFGQFARQNAEAERSIYCEANHQLDARLARYLLTVQDRTGVSALRMTQELLAGELGVLRSSVSLAANRFSRQGWTVTKRGHIYITDRPGLMSAACDCYEAMALLQAREAEAPAGEFFPPTPVQDRIVAHVA